MDALENLLKEIQNVKVIDDSISYTEYIPLDLSVSNIELSKLAIDDATVFERRVTC